MTYQHNGDAPAPVGPTSLAGVQVLDTSGVANATTDARDAALLYAWWINQGRRHRVGHLAPAMTFRWRRPS